MRLHAGAAWTIRESAPNVYSGRQKPCHTGEWNLCQYCIWPFWPMHYQLSYPTLKQVWSLQLSVVVVVYLQHLELILRTSIHSVLVSLCASILHHDVTFQNAIKNWGHNFKKKCFVVVKHALHLSYMQQSCVNFYSYVLIPLVFILYQCTV